MQHKWLAILLGLHCTGSWNSNNNFLKIVWFSTVPARKAFIALALFTWPFLGLIIVAEKMEELIRLLACAHSELQERCGIHWTQTTWTQHEEEIVFNGILDWTKHRSLASPITFPPLSFPEGVCNFFPIHTISQIVLADIMQIHLCKEKCPYLHSKGRQPLGSFSYCFQL